MSLGLVPVPLAKVIVPNININGRKEYVIVKGAKESTWQVFNAQNLNVNQINITSNPPSRQHVVNRRAYINAAYTLTFNGTAGVGQTKLLQPGLDAPRQYPIAQSLNTLQSSINNDNFSVTLNQYWNTLLRYHHKNTEAQFNSTTPAYLDTYQEYVDQLLPFTGGSNKNALGGYGEVADGDCGASGSGGRGGFPFTIVSDNGTQAVVTMNVTEPVFMDPWNYSEREQQGFIGVENMSWTFSFGDLRSSLWSHDNLATGHGNITSMAVTITAFNVLLNFQTLPMDMIPPAMSVYPYFEVIPYSTPSMLFPIPSNPPVAQTLVMNSVQLKSIPRRMYIFAQEDLNDRSFDNSGNGGSGINKTNTFGIITNLNISFNNKVGLLSTASQQELYYISQSNGCNMSWPAFSKYVGSPIAIDFSKDLSLAENEASGLIGNYQLGVQATVINGHATSSALDASMNPIDPGRAIRLGLWVVVINEGQMNIVNGSVSHQIGVFSANDVLTTPIDPNLTFKKTQEIYGGDFWDTVKGIHKFVKENKLISKGLKYIPNQYAQLGSKAADYLGYGEGVSGGKRRKAKGKKRRGGDDGGDLEGGRMVSRSQLRSRLGGGECDGGDSGTDYSDSE